MSGKKSKVKLGQYFIFDSDWEERLARAELYAQDKTHIVSIQYRAPAVTEVIDDGNGIIIKEADVTGKVATIRLDYSTAADLLTAIKILSHYDDKRFAFGYPIIKGEEVK